MFPQGLSTLSPPSLRAPKLPADLALGPAPVATPPPPLEPAPIEPTPGISVRLGRFPLAIAGGALALLLLIVIVALRLGGGQSASPNAASATPTPSAASGSESENKTAPKSLLERAQSGDAAALEALLAIAPDKRTPEQAFALTRGQQMRERQDLDRLLGELDADPARLRDRTIQRRLLAAARDPITGTSTLRALTTIDAPQSSDLIYEVWTGTRGKTPMSELAESLAHTEPVRRRASPALGVAMDLRTAASCDAAKEAVEQAIPHGDRRSLRPLARLTVRRGCGPHKLVDCYPCLRKGDALRKAIAAARTRRPPL
jgi:hypothetical protein